MLSKALAQESFALYVKTSPSFGGRSAPGINIRIMWYVYLLKCADHSIYTGCTGNLDERIQRHLNGKVHYTRNKLPVELITTIGFSDQYRAYQFEKHLKSGSGIAFRNKPLVWFTRQ